MKQRCPACGSDTLLIATVRRSYAPPFGTAVEFNVPIVTCQSCNEAFEGENAGEITKAAISDADRSSARGMVEQLEKQRITMAYMERVLGLAPRTVARWKSGEVSAAALALLRIVRTFPWILRVAGARFDETKAREVMSAEVFSTRNRFATVVGDKLASNAPRAKVEQYITSKAA